MESAILIYSVRHQAFGRELAKRVKALGWDVSTENGEAVIVIADAHSWAAEGVRTAYEEWGWRMDANRLLVLWVSAWAPVPVMLPPGSWVRGWTGGQLSPSEGEVIRQFLARCSQAPSRTAPARPDATGAMPPPPVEPLVMERKEITAAVELPPAVPPQAKEITAAVELPPVAKPAPSLEPSPEPEIFASQSLAPMKPELKAETLPEPAPAEDVPTPRVAPPVFVPIPPVIAPVPSIPQPAPAAPMPSNPRPAPAAPLPPPMPSTPLPRASGTGSPDRGYAAVPALPRAAPPAPALKKSPLPGPLAAAPRQEARTSVFCPETLEKGRWFTLQVWLHGPEQSGEVARLAAEAGHGELAGRKSGLAIASGALVGFSLVPRVLQTKRALFGSREPQHRYAQWNESATNVDFAVCCPKSFREQVLHETIEISVEGIPVGSCTVELAFDRSGEMKTEFAKIRTAFASYASQDRELVIGRLQMLAATVGVEPFFDVDSLRMGEDWEQRLLREVPTKDRFLLFWSDNARKSEWVEREWRLALREKGLDYILPVPLQPASPPKELSKLQFNDRYARMAEYERLRRKEKT